jgi:acyl-CoA hydrolase
VVTAGLDLHFHAAIRVGWVVTLQARVLAAFRSSMEVGVMVRAENPLTGEQHLTTSALLTFVALNSNGGRAEVPPLLLESPEERAASEAAHARRKARLERKGRVAEWTQLFDRLPAG